MVTAVSHLVLCYRAKDGHCFGKCSCGVLLKWVDCADDLMPAIRQHDPNAQWVKHES